MANGKNFRALFEEAAQALGDGQWQRAEELLREVLVLRPRHPEGLHLLGLICAQTGRVAESVGYLRQAVALKPYFVEAMGNLGAALVAVGDAAEAETLLRQVILLKPGDAVAQSNLGRALQQLGRDEEALAAYRAALALRPGFAETYYRMARALEERGELDEAIAACEKAAALAPGMLDARNGLGTLLVKAGRIDEAMTLFRQVAAADPTHEEAASNLLTTLNYDWRASAETVAAAHRAWGERFDGGAATASFANGRDPEKVLRVAYVSADLRAHSVAYFLEPLLAGHARQGRQVEAICYADNRWADAMTERLRSLAAGWVHSSGMSHEALAARLRADGIDIAVELGGHTVGNRLAMFGRRVAPVQVSYLGYPNTTGLAAMDYRLTDGVADPPGASDAWHTEKLWRLPRTFLCYRPPGDAPAVAEREAGGEGEVVLGCFNAVSKINPALLACWGGAMRALPRSRLLLKGVGMTSRANKRRILEGLAVADISPERVEFLEATKGVAEHLALYGGVDIALDTWPYNGTTTTCEALWMGVPVVTQAGDRHAARVGASLLRTVGLGELVADTAEAFAAIVAGLARDRKRLHALRVGMRGRMERSALMEEAGFARDVEEAYRAMWRAWCAQPG